MIFIASPQPIDNIVSNDQPRPGCSHWVDDTATTDFATDKDFTLIDINMNEGSSYDELINIPNKSMVVQTGNNDNSRVCILCICWPSHILIITNLVH